MIDLSRDCGVNMMAYCKRHEEYISKQLAAKADVISLYDYHNDKLRYLQHERLIHLIAGISALLFFSISLFKNDIFFYLLLVMSIALFIAYLIYYFRIENRTQRWYLLSDIIYGAAHQIENNENIAGQ